MCVCVCVCYVFGQLSLLQELRSLTAERLGLSKKKYIDAKTIAMETHPFHPKRSRRCLKYVETMQSGGAVRGKSMRSILIKIQCTIYAKLSRSVLYLQHA